MALYSWFSPSLSSALLLQCLLGSSSPRSTGRGLTKPSHKVFSTVCAAVRVWASQATTDCVAAAARSTMTGHMPPKGPAQFPETLERTMNVAIRRARLASQVSPPLEQIRGIYKHKHTPHTVHYFPSLLIILLNYCVLYCLSLDITLNIRMYT